MADFHDLDIVVYVIGASGPSFHVQIHGSKDVSNLRAAIKQEKAAELEGIASNRLQLHKVRLKVDGVDDEHLEQRICEEVERAKNDGDFELLNQSLRRLGTCFTRAYWQSVVGDMVHLLVTPPSNDDASIQIEESHQLAKTSRSAKRPAALEEDTTPKTIPPYLFKYHEQYWGKPLPPTWTNLGMSPEMEVDNPENKSEAEAEAEAEVVLESNIIRGTFRPIFVRAEYLRAFQAVSSLYESSSNTHIAVLTGQPGIGKTVWITYALLRCLSSQQPVIWYRQETFVYFSESGLSSIDPMTHASGKKYTWCLVDSVDAASTLPTTMTQEGVELFPIYVTSPQESRWISLPQRRPTQILVMNPWSLNELEAAAKRLPNVNELSKVRKRFEMAGPTARLCLRDSYSEVANFVSSRQATINSLVSKEKVLEIFNYGSILQLHACSHRICLVRRCKVAKFDGPYYIKPMTPTVEQLLLHAFFALKKQEIVHLYNMFNPIEAAHGITGAIFEAYWQKMLANGSTLMAAPMFRT